MRAFIIFSIVFFCSVYSLGAITLSGSKPSDSSQNTAISNESSIAISVSSSFSLTPKTGTKARLLFNKKSNNAEGGTTTEALLAGVMRTVKKNGKKKIKYYTVATARSKNICKKSKAKGLWYFKKDSSGILAEAHTDDSGYVDQYELTAMNSKSGKKMAKTFKKYLDKKSKVSIDKNCVVSGNGL